MHYTQLNHTMQESFLPGSCSDSMFFPGVIGFVYYKGKGRKAMTLSMERAVARSKSKLANLWAQPGKLRFAPELSAAAGGVVLAAAPVWNHPMPLAAVWAVTLGPRCKPAAALGAALGYGLFWPGNGGKAAVWAAVVLLTSMVPRLTQGRLLTAAAGCATALTSLLFQIFGLEDVNFGLFCLELFAAMAAAELFTRWSRGAKLSLASLWLLGLGKISPGLGLFACGVGLAVLPPSAVITWGAALELSGTAGGSAAALAAGGLLLRQLPLPVPWGRCLAPGLSAAAVMALSARFFPRTALCFALGGLVGGMLPEIGRQAAFHRGSGSAQVRLEQMARLFTQFQHTLLELPPQIIDESAFVEKIRVGACACCTARNICTQSENIDAGLLHGDLRFRCRKTGRVLREVQVCQAQMQQLRLSHSRQEECRQALVQQYGYLSGLLELLSDKLAGQVSSPPPAYRIQVSARCRRREAENGDRCMAFAGDGCRFFVLLCDGMGTGQEAAVEAQRTASMIRSMLLAGMPPQYALGCLNSQLALRQLAGAVTVDLAEIQLDSGKAAVYKWGAAPSFLVHRGKFRQVGQASLPPGLSLEGTQEGVSQFSLSRGEWLIMVTDGVELAADILLAQDSEAAVMAQRILENQPEGADDATAAVIHLLPLKDAA